MYEQTCNVNIAKVDHIIYQYIIYTGCLKKRGLFLKLVKFLYLSGNLSEILYGSSKMILLGSEKDFIYTQKLQQEVTS